MTDVASVFKFPGAPVRIRTVCMLAENGEMCVCKIMEQLNMTQPAVSHLSPLLKTPGWYDLVSILRRTKVA